MSNDDLLSSIAVSDAKEHCIANRLLIHGKVTKNLIKLATVPAKVRKMKTQYELRTL